MIDSIKEFWYMWLVLAVLLVVLVIVIRKASKAAKKRNEIMKKQRENMERFKFVTEKYKELDKELAENADAKELAEGVAMVLQYRLEKSGNPDAEYANAEQWKREVYALYFFDEDCQTSLSFFFKNNGEPLPSVAVKGLKSIGADKIYSTVAQMYSMYDDKNESVSLDKAKVEELDKKFSDIYDREAYFELVRKYIIDNL